MFAGLIWIFYIIWMFITSIKISKNHKILNYRRNLLTIRSHALMSISILSYISIEQMLNKVLEIFYEDLAVKNVFAVWWTWHLMEKIVWFFLKHIFIIWEVKTTFPAFDGHFGEVYPGSERLRSTCECK